MPKGKVYARMTVSLPPKVSEQIRKEALKNKASLSEMVERYHEAYLREIERERWERKAKKAGNSENIEE